MGTEWESESSLKAWLYGLAERQHCPLVEIEGLPGQARLSSGADWRAANTAQALAGGPWGNMPREWLQGQPRPALWLGQAASLRAEPDRLAGQTSDWDREPSAVFII